MSGQHDGLGDRNPGNIIFNMKENIKAATKQTELRENKDSIEKVNENFRNVKGAK